MIFVVQFHNSKDQIHNITVIQEFMTENKITMTIKPAQPKKMVADGMIALKKIQHYAYALSDEIGLGFSSHVYRGKNQLNNEPVAIKVIDLKKEDELSRQFMNEEINILQMIKAGSPVNLLKLYDVFKTKNNLYIITEFCEGKDVAKLLRKKKKLTEAEAQSILKQLLKAYRQIYEMSIVHRDLKLANIFIRKGVVKLADFGFAIHSDRCLEKFDYNVGSPYYMPPESLKFNRYSYKSDVWSIGIIAYEMIYGHLPWKEKVQSILFQKITTTSIDQMFEPDVQISDHYKNFIRSCLQIDYDKRATPQFIINYDWPIAYQYIEGVQPQGNNNATYKPLSMVKVHSQNQTVSSKNFTSHNIDEQGKEQRQKIPHFGTSNQYRDRSPVHKAETKNGNPFQPHHQQRHKTIFRQNMFSNKGQLFQSSEMPVSKPLQPLNFINNLPQNSTNTQMCILSQVHYCKFMSNLYDLLQQHKMLPDVNLLKAELVNKIMGKIQILMRLREGENLLQVEGFNSYRSSERWAKLRDIIDRFDAKYRQKYPMEFKSDSYDQALVNAIKFLKNNISNNFGLLEELTYFYQLKDLERRQNLLTFAVNSKIELLSSRKPLGRQEVSNPLLCQRLNNRLGLLGF